MISFNSFKIVKVRYPSLNKIIESEEQAKTFEKFFSKLLEVLYFNTDLPFEKRIVVSVVVDRQANGLVVVSNTQNRLTFSDLASYFFWLPTKGWSIKRNLTEIYKMKKVIALVLMNWDLIYQRIEKYKKKGNCLISQSDDIFEKNHKLLLEQLSQARV